VEGAARNEQHRPLPRRQVGTDHRYRPGAVGPQHQHLQRVAQVVMVLLVGERQQFYCIPTLEREAVLA
jgi:hypothetical protein